MFHSFMIYSSAHVYLRLRPVWSTPYYVSKDEYSNRESQSSSNANTYVKTRNLTIKITWFPDKCTCLQESETRNLYSKWFKN